MIVCCREARKSGNLKLAHSLMGRLPKGGVGVELNPTAIRIARESAKQVYSNNNSSSALQKMSNIALNKLDESEGKDISELVAR